MLNYASCVNEVNESFEEFLETPSQDTARALAWHMGELNALVAKVASGALKRASEEPLRPIAKATSNVIPLRRKS